ncbi:MAG: rod shape-determining protein MreD [Proteobacteria bacterium]|nr:rod shape-determining protein MreD [Pseudomonadota bacterium]
MLTLFVVLLKFVPLPVPDYGLIAPDFVLMAVFYWTVHRADLMRPAVVFVVGLLDDILSGVPLGLSALTLLLVHWTIVSQHRAFRSRSFAIIWCGFALIAVGVQVLVTVLALVIGGAPVQPIVFAAKLAITVGLYPALAWVMGCAQRAFLVEA